MKKPYYPIAIRLKNKKAIIVGGGTVAERKIIGLLEAGARVTVISPSLTEKLKALVKNRQIIWIAHPVKRDDLLKADIVIAATSDNAVNKKISGWSRRIKKPVNVVDNKILSDFISPAVFKEQKAIIAVYTDGKDPVLSRDLKNFIKERWDEFLSYRHRS